jgi:hypothetical protein
MVVVVVACSGEGRGRRCHWGGRRERGARRKKREEGINAFRLFYS